MSHLQLHLLPDQHPAASFIPGNLSEVWSPAVTSSLFDLKQPRSLTLDGVGEGSLNIHL